MDMTLFSILMIMIAFGLVMVFSASSPSAFYQQNDQFYYIKRQAIWTGVGFVVMLIMSNVDYKVIKKWAGAFCAATFVMMILVPIIGVESNGAKRWLAFGPLQFQPSEMTKPAIALLLACAFSRDIILFDKEKIKQYLHKTYCDNIRYYISFLLDFQCIQTIRKETGC